jgi:hypothetical protein
MYDSVYNDTVMSASAVAGLNMAGASGIAEKSEERNLLSTKARLEINPDDFD